MNKKTIFRGVLLTLGVVLLSLGIEIFGFEWKSITSPKNSYTYNLEDGEIIENPLDGRTVYAAAGDTISQTDDYSENIYDEPVFYRFSFPSEFLNEVTLYANTEVDLEKDN